MIFGNPVRSSRIENPSIRGNTVFGLTQKFGPTSFTAEPSLSWQGGEGIGAGFYSHFHKGLDLSNQRCGDDVIAAQAGTVYVSQVTSAGEHIIVIDHGSGWMSAYGHLASRAVSKGARVTKGQKIGTVGTTGNSTACHLHFMVKSDVQAGANFYAASIGKLRDPWPRLAQNVTIALRDDGINVRVDANMGAVYASSKPDGLIHRAADNEQLGPFSAQRAWGGTVAGASYTIGGVTGKAWDKISIGGGWRYVAAPLGMKSAS